MPVSGLEFAKKNKNYAVELRRYFHKYPELGMQEWNTANRICEELSLLGIAYERVCGTGVLAVVPGEAGQPVIGIRADMDALLITEQNNTEYSSQREGLMHACGHDAHIAILLTVAKFLAENKQNATIKLIFQPSEENVCGAERLLGEKPDFFQDLDFVAAVHVWNSLQCGKISVEAGERMAAPDTFKIAIRGKMCHGAMPQEGIDSVYIGAQVVLALQGIISREQNPLDPAVVTVGSFHAGTTDNVIAGEAVLEGTSRSFTMETRMRLEKRIREIAKGVAQTYGATCEVEYGFGPPSVVNDKEVSVIAEACVTDLFGAEGLAEVEKVMGGEDFALFLKKTAGCLAFVGSGYDGCAAHHHPNFDIDENALVNGAAFLIELAQRLAHYKK